MSTVKLSVTIVLPGSTMMSSQECDENPKENYNKHRVLLSVKHFDKKTRKTFYKKEAIEFQTRKCIPAQQVLKMSEEAYKAMVSEMCPVWFMPNVSKWKRLSKEARLHEHLDRLCESMQGLYYTYAVFDD